MSNMTERMQRFVEGRAAGLEPRAAGLAAGYSAATVESAVSRLGKRDDVRKAIAALKRKTTGNTQKDESDSSEDGMGLRNKYDSPLEFMDHCMNNPKLPAGLRFEAAKQMLAYRHARIGEKGKKDSDKDEAGKVSGKDGPYKMKRPPTGRPNLRAVK